MVVFEMLGWVYLGVLAGWGIRYLLRAPSVDLEELLAHAALGGLLGGVLFRLLFARVDTIEGFHWISWVGAVIAAVAAVLWVLPRVHTRLERRRLHA
jgi:hypothetical protein